MEIEDRNLGYSPLQMRQARDRQWRKGYGLVYVKDLADESAYLDMPLVRLTAALIDKAADGIRLTKNGYLPNKIIAELYPLGPKDFFIECCDYKLGRHVDCHVLCQVWDVLMQTGIFKVVSDKLKLTVAGKRLAGHPGTLFRYLLKAMSTSADTFILDALEVAPFNDKVEMMFVLLKRYGMVYTPISDYAEAYALIYYGEDFFLDVDSGKYSFDSVSSAFNIRILDRFLGWFGLIQYDNDPMNLRVSFMDRGRIKASPLFSKFIGVNPPAGPEPTQEESEALNKALDLYELFYPKEGVGGYKS